MTAALLATLFTTTPTAEAFGWCSTTDWQDLIDHAPGSFVYGGNRAAGVGGKGSIDFANDTLTFDVYDNGTWVGGADVDGPTNSAVVDAGITTFTPVSYGFDCNDPSTLRYLIQVQAAGASFYAYALP
jgi:hypothetical protein